MTSDRKPFTVAQALDSGLSRDALLAACYQRVHWGVYAGTDLQLSHADRVRVALQTIGAAQFASHFTAARLLGVVAPTASHIHLGTRLDRPCKRPGIRLHRYRSSPEVVVRQGIPVTSVAQTFRDLAAKLELIDLLVLGDSIVRRGLLSPDELSRHLDGRFIGGPVAREAAALVREHVDSPQETRLRLLVVSGGLPEPTVNLSVRDTNGEVRRRIDLGYEDWLVAVEFDGRHHIQREAQWRADLRRREELEAQGWRFVVVTSTDLYSDPHEIVVRIRDALRRAGAPTYRIDPGWMRHFGGQ